MTVYISGPISGMPDGNKKAFKKGQAEIASVLKTAALDEKAKIINPVKIGLKLEKAFAAAGKEPQWADYMRLCIKKLCDADIVYFLKNWELSAGASAERYIATRLNIPCAETINGLSKVIGNYPINQPE